ncbi:hypothetical protein KW787_02755 [Candidatus Pacearchaeota archaeon]|nr:hypothetical protein [Candidatus Pacearchaeota archaeon]
MVDEEKRDYSEPKVRYIPYHEKRIEAILRAGIPSLERTLEEAEESRRVTNDLLRLRFDV